MNMEINKNILPAFSIMLDTVLRDDFLREEIISDRRIEDEFAENGRERKWVRCRNCHGKTALVADRIEIERVKVHIFSNPAGIMFRVICFSDACGAVNVTEYTGDHSWFQGYLWSVSLCRFCGNHIGWHYNSGLKGFYGLIADRLCGI